MLSVTALAKVRRMSSENGKEPVMANSQSFLSLRTVLLVDASACLIMGAALVAASGALASLLSIPAALLFYAGLSLFPIAALMAFVGTRSSIPQLGVWAIVLGNLGWVAVSVALLVTDWIAPNGLGVVFIAAQAAFVAIMAWLEHAGLRGAQVAHAG
jgi:hypothetical protein